jgi:inorganic pyrophosphatase
MEFDWHAWEVAIRAYGIQIERPKGTAHPRYPDMIYPIDYGFVPNTMGDDGYEIDIFAGTEATGLSAMLVTHDTLKGDNEIKLLWNVSSQEIAILNNFLNAGSMFSDVIWRHESSSTDA